MRTKTPHQKGIFNKQFTLMNTTNHHKAWIRTGMIFLFLITCFTTIAQEYTVDNVPNVRLQDRTK